MIAILTDFLFYFKKIMVSDFCQKNLPQYIDIPLLLIRSLPLTFYYSLIKQRYYQWG